MCDTVTDGGGWTIFQRRVSGVVDFYRNWEEYKHGFGDFDAGEFYLGNEHLYCLTSNGSYQLRIDMTYNGIKYFAAYSNFTIQSESNLYKLLVSGFSGNALDGLNTYHNNQSFSTYDVDNDQNSGFSCAQRYYGAWWYNTCFQSNLNGLYGKTEMAKGLLWSSLTRNAALENTEMKFKSV
ncbi:ficolin-1-like [Physella acuta]|uniref:ficolin-1-like n=1 Tax=Physella acuta TaxID=109671 RepID=UPI0027DE8401|nr:ficolin-1-like [Physella acuta]